jgi:hypothetical protein
MPLDTQPAALTVAIAALTSVVSAAGFSSCYGSVVAGHGRTTDLSYQRRCPAGASRLIWRFGVERVTERVTGRVTGIEPALSAWE